MSSSVSLIQSFRKSSISITFTSDSSYSMLSSLSARKSSTMSSFVGADHQIRPPSWTSWHKEPLVLERSPFCVFRQPFRNGGVWLAAFQKRLRKRRSWLDICLLCVETRHQCGFMNTHMRTQTAKWDNLRLIYCSFVLIPLLLFENVFFSILSHGFSKTHPPRFLNNKYVCVTK